MRKDRAVGEAKGDQKEKELKDANALIEKTNGDLQTKEAEFAKLTQLISGLRAERAEHESELEKLRLAALKNETRITELEDNRSGITIRRETTEENQKNLVRSISDAYATRDEIEK